MRFHQAVTILSSQHIKLWIQNTIKIPAKDQWCNRLHNFQPYMGCQQNRDRHENHAATFGSILCITKAAEVWLTIEPHPDHFAFVLQRSHSLFKSIRIKYSIHFLDPGTTHHALRRTQKCEPTHSHESTLNLNLKSLKARSYLVLQSSIHSLASCAFGSFSEAFSDPFSPGAPLPLLLAWGVLPFELGGGEAGAGEAACASVC